MSQDNQQDQSHVIGEMFDAANVAQPVPPQGIPGSITPSNIQLSEPLSTDDNGFTSDNVQPPVPTPQPIQEDRDE